MAINVEQLRELAELYDQWQASLALPPDALAAEQDRLQHAATLRGEEFANAFATMIKDAAIDGGATTLPPLTDGARNAAVVASLSAGDAAPKTPISLDTQPPPREPGHRIGPYRLIKEIGRGGMGVVWLAARADGQHERQVALKMPLVENLNWLLAARFARERNILASLEHPGIARLYDAGVDSETQPYIALEYVLGVPINEYVRDQRLKPEATVALFTKVINAVSHAHAQLVIHRDIKPSNILVDAQGEPHLLDFGIAKLLDDEDSMSADATQLTRMSGRALTLDYASPEQVNGQTLGTASDVYALGVVLYELLTGNKPYAPKGPTRRDLELAIIEQEPAKPSERLALTGSSEAGKTARRIRGDLDTVVLKALKKDPKQRYATAQAFADDLKRYLAYEPIAAKPDAGWYRLGRFVRRNRWALAAAGVIAATVAVGVVSTLWQAQRAEREALRATNEAAQKDALAKVAQVAAADARQQAATALREAQRADQEALRAESERDLAKGAAVNANQANSRAQVSAVAAARERDRATAEANIAAGEARRANAVNDYLTEVFLTNTLNQQDSVAAQKTTALELLERGADTVSGRLQNEPKALSKMLETFGLLFHNFGQYPKAMAISQQNLDLRMANQFSALEQLQAGTALGALYISLNKYDELAALVERLKPVEARVAKANPDDMGPYYSVVGQLKRRLGQTDAIDTLEKAHRILLAGTKNGKGAPSDVPTLFVTSGFVSFSYADRGEFDRALSLIDSTLEAAKPYRSKYWAYFGRLLSERGHILRLAGRFMEADRAVVAGQSVYRENGYPNHPNISVMDTFRVEGLARTGQWRLYADVSERSFADERKVDSNSNAYWQTLFIATAHGTVLGDPQACTQIASMLSAVKGRPMYAGVMRARMWPLITLCLGTGLETETRAAARAWLAEALQAQSGSATGGGSSSNPDFVATMQRENALATLDIADARFKEAYVRTAALIDGDPPAQNLRRLMNWLDMVPTYCDAVIALREGNRCLTLIERIVPLLESNVETAAWRPAKARLLFWRARALQGEGRLEEARDTASKALREHQEVNPPGSVYTTQAANLLQSLSR